MSQHDMVISNQTFPNTRLDMNAAIQALASQQSGATEPTIRYPYQLWYDTSTELLKMSNAAMSAWITLAFFDTSNDRWELRSNVIQSLSAAGVTIKDASGVDLFTIAATGVVTVTGTIAGLTAAAAKTTPVDADSLTILDSAATDILKKLTWANLKVTLKAYFDTLYNLTVQATTTAVGHVELATPAEGATGTDSARVPAVDVVKSMIEAHGGMRVVASWTHSVDVGNVDFADLDGYSSLIVILHNVTMSSSLAFSRIRVSDDNGTSFYGDGGSNAYRGNYVENIATIVDVATSGIGGMTGGTTFARDSIMNILGFNTDTCPTTFFGSGAFSTSAQISHALQDAVVACDAIRIGTHPGEAATYDFTGGSIYVLGQKG